MEDRGFFGKSSYLYACKSSWPTQAGELAERISGKVTKTEVSAALLFLPIEQDPRYQSIDLLDQGRSPGTKAAICLGLRESALQWGLGRGGRSCERYSYNESGFWIGNQCES